MPKFDVQKTNTDITPDTEENAAAGTTGGSDAVADGQKGTSAQVQIEDATETSTLENHETKRNLYLYEEDMKQMPRVATFLRGLANYHTTLPTERDIQDSKKKKAKLGTVLGVYLPTIQHIFGVLMFVRLAWIVGHSGTLEAFFMVLMCCITTFVTAISMSAIATNGMVQAGGSYFMISRNLGPECGGAVGICFYLANTFATDLYILGSIEIFLIYMAPGLAFFGDIHKDPFNNFRVYGTVVLILLAFLVAVGVKFVAFFAPFSLACVIISILCVFIGAFEANENTRNLWICFLGDRLIADRTFMRDGVAWCNKSTEGPIYQHYCGSTDSYNSTAEDCSFFWSANASYVAGIPGMFSGIINKNLFSNYMKYGEVAPGVPGSYDRGEVISDMTTTWVMLAAIYFPSVTGIMTGSNMSGDLRDPQKSIPVGTILAQLTCSFVYLSFVIFFGSTAEGALLRDKFGHSVGGKLLASQLAWPSHWVVLVGGFCSTIGAALQCITSAPRLLQAIARDNIIPFLDWFRVTTAAGEPLRALVLTFFIAEIGICIASLDYVAHVIDVFFLMCYAVVNLTCALQTLLRTPSWRPRFKYYHWTLALVGVGLNLTLSIIAGWYYALAAFVIALGIYKYVEFKGGEKAWGDGIQGLSMTAAQRALLALDEEPHTKNWRPQLLVLCKVDQGLNPKYDMLFHFTSQLKAGRGLTIYATILQGDFVERAEEAEKTKELIKLEMNKHKTKGFAKVMVTKDVTEGLSIFVQTVGLGGMRHNTVLVCWPDRWHQSHDEKDWEVFINAVKAVNARELALLVPRGIQNFPNNSERLTGTIDIWWIVHDGGMLILLSHLLRQHKVWRGCKTRIFTVAQMHDNSIQLEKDLKHFLYQLRIDAEVIVEEMYETDISAYTVERTLDMEKRAKMLRDLNLQRRQTVQGLMDRSASVRSLAANKGTTPAITLQVDTRSQQFLGGSTVEDMDGPSPNVHYTFTPSYQRINKGKNGKEEETLAAKESGGRLMRMHTALRLNQAIRARSGEAQLVILNFPGPPAKLTAEENYMEYLEALTEGLPRVLMVRGSGREVVTIYS